MHNLYEEFFNAFWEPGMKSVYTDKVSKEMMASPIDKEGWYEWRLIKGNLTFNDYKAIELKFNVKFPYNFIEWHKLYFFADGDCRIIRLPKSLPGEPLIEIERNLDWDVPEKLIPLGLIPFADDGNDGGPLVFDTRNANDETDFPIRFYEHEYAGDPKGLSDVIFSSFEKLLECLIFYLSETKNKKSFEVIPHFYEIDPNGAGSTGRIFWDKWVEMQKGNYEMFGK